MCMCTCVYGVCVYMHGCVYACVCIRVCMICVVYLYENLTNWEIFIYVVPRAPTSMSGPCPPCSASCADIRSSPAPPPSPLVDLACRRLRKCTFLENF
jgi:hypothetical protein